MAREVLSLHVGQAGCQMGNATWELLCQEHSIQTDGRCSTNPEKSFTTFFQNTESGQYVPRALFVDLEPSVVDEIQKGKYEKLFNPTYMISGKEDAANNFARGRYTEGKKILDTTLDRVRNMAECCDNLQSLMVTHSCGGGTGSGFTSILMEGVNEEYKKKVLFGVDVYPSAKISTSMVEPYNSILSTYANRDFFNIGLPIDNEAVYDICCRQLELPRPSYDNLNRVTSQIMSAITVSARFPGALNTDLNEFSTNLVPFPDLRYVISGFAPLTSKKKSTHEIVTTQSITASVMSPNNRMIKCDIMKGTSFGSMFLYRGQCTTNEVNETLAKIKADKKVMPVSAAWVPCPFKIGLNSRAITTVENSSMAPAAKAVTVLMNNSGITALWKNLEANFKVMFRHRAFVHWFVGEGMEEAEFNVAYEAVQALVNKYETM